MMKRHTALVALALLATAPLISGCVGVAVTSAGAAVLMSGDRRTAGYYVEDENIEWKVVGLANDRFKGSHINGTSYNRKVLLTGEAPSEADRKSIEDAVKGIENVREVANEIVVAGHSSIASRGNDSLITSNVKARMVGNGKFSPNHVKVVTEAGTVYLMGLVTQAEGEAAGDIARSTSGVTRVVKVFEYIQPK
jgi:osmotically-inducible protein OsmY